MKQKEARYGPLKNKFTQVSLQQIKLVKYAESKREPIGSIVSKNFYN